MKSSKRFCCCRKFKAAGLVASFGKGEVHAFVPAVLLRMGEYFTKAQILHVHAEVSRQNESSPMRGLVKGNGAAARAAREHGRNPGSLISGLAERTCRRAVQTREWTFIAGSPVAPAVARAPSARTDPPAPVAGSPAGRPSQSASLLYRAFCSKYARKRFRWSPSCRSIRI